jgi:HK97 family phage portal protein
MSLLNLFTKNAITKNPTAKQDYIAYSQGAKSEYDSTYNDYVQSVEALDKAVRVIANIASMAKIETFSEMANGKLKPLKIKNVDFTYNTNDQDSEHDLLSMIFGSIFTQGAAIVLTQDNKATKFKNFFSYDVSRFKIYAKENNLFDSFVYSSEGGQEVIYKPTDLIYIAPRISSSNLVYAVSRLKALNDMLLLQSNIMRQSNEYYAAGGKKSAIISPKEPMGKDSAGQLKEAFDSFLQTPATKTLFINTEVDVKEVSSAQSPREIMEALKTINTLLIEQFGLPPYLYGDFSGYVNDAAVVTACRLFFQIQMMPVFRSVEYQFTRYFRNTLKIKGAVVKLNFEDVEILKDDLKVKTDRAQGLLKQGIISFNEAREMCELHPLPDAAADLNYLPAYLLGQYPVSLQNYDVDMAKLFDTSGLAGDTPDGAAGGTDNENVVTGSTGGAGNIGE